MGVSARVVGFACVGVVFMGDSFIRTKTAVLIGLELGLGLGCVFHCVRTDDTVSLRHLEERLFRERSGKHNLQNLLDLLIFTNFGGQGGYGAKRSAPK